MVETHRVRSPEERRRLELARRRYARRFRKIDDLKRRGPQFIMVLLSLFALSLIFYRLFGPELLREDDEVVNDTFASTEMEDALNTRVDPEPLRSEFEAFERSFFGAESARGLEDLKNTIVADAYALSDRVRQLADESPRLTAVGTRLQTITAELQNPGFDLDLLADLRQGWVDSRAAVFRRADWFSFPADTFSEDVTYQVAYRDAASTLLELTEFARAEAESFSEYVADGESIDDPWRDFERDFTEQLREVELSIPVERPGVKASSQLLAAIQKLERTVDFVREQVAIEKPRSPLNSQPYDRAVNSAQEALDAFDSLEN